MGWKSLVSIVALSLFLVSGCIGNIVRNTDNVAGPISRNLPRGAGGAVHGLTAAQEQTWINAIETSPEDIYNGSCFILGFASATGDFLPSDSQIGMWVNGNGSAASEQYGFDPQDLSEEEVSSIADQMRAAEMSPSDYVAIFDKACDADKFAV